MLKKTESCPDCGRWDNRGVSVDVVIVRDNRILLGKRRNNPYKWHWGTVGGYVEWDETSEQAAIREYKEETNLDVTSLKLIGVYSDPSRHPKQVISIAYAVEFNGNELAGDDIAEVQWFDLDNLPTEMAFDHAKIITDYLNSLDKS